MKEIDLVTKCEHCQRDEENKNETFDETHVIYKVVHYPWAIGMDYYVTVGTDKSKKPWRDVVYVIADPKRGDQVVIANHHTFWPYEEMPLDHRQLCGTGIIRDIRGRDVKQHVNVEVHEWFHEGAAPKSLWVPIYNLCQVSDVTRVREDLETAWNFVGISREHNEQ